MILRLAKHLFPDSRCRSSLARCIARCVLVYRPPTRKDSSLLQQSRLFGCCLCFVSLVSLRLTFSRFNVDCSAVIGWIACTLPKGRCDQWSGKQWLLFFYFFVLWGTPATKRILSSSPQVWRRRLPLMTLKGVFTAYSAMLCTCRLAFGKCLSSFKPVDWSRMRKEAREGSRF